MKGKVLLGIVAVTSWFALISQYYLILQNSAEPFLTTTINFFSYFTILTNLLVAICATLRIKNQKIIAATAVYITIVGVVYNLVLRFVWDPQGLQKVTDELLHSVNPVLFVIYWLAFVPKNELRWKDAFSWLIYPLIYSLYTALHGFFTDWYPYPFINASENGWTMTAIISLFIIVMFYVLSLIAIGVAVLSNRTAKV